MKAVWKQTAAKKLTAEVKADRWDEKSADVKADHLVG